VKKYLLIILLFLSLNLFSTEDIETIIITEETEKVNKFDKNTKQISIISKEEISLLPGASTSELISSAMGVAMSKMGNDASPSFISIRGSSPEQVLIMLNGKRLNSSQGGGVDLSTISPESIKEIEVIRGGGSAVYGESAFGGVVNIITDENINSYIRIKYDYNIENRNILSLNLNKNFKGLNVNGGIYGIYSPGNYDFLYRESSRQRINSDLKSIFGSFNLNFLINNIDITLNNSLYTADKGVPGIIEFPSITARMKDLEYISGINFNFIDLFFIDVTYLNKIRDYKDSDAPLGAISSNHDYKSLSSTFSYNNTIELSSRFDYLDSTTIDKNIRREAISLYISPQYIFSKILIHPSIRIDTVIDSDIIFSWSLGFSYNFDSQNRHSLKSSVANSYRLPSFNDLFWPQTSFAIGNSNLKNENAIIFDLGIITALTGNLKLETTLYYHDISNLIQWNPGPNGLWSPNNLGSAQIKGLETELSYLIDFLPIYGYLEGRINYTYLSALNRDPGILFNKQLINRPSHKGNVILIYYHYNSFKISLDTTFTGESYITSANTKSRPGYTLVDLNTIIPITDELILNIYGKNLLNRNYTDYRGYPVPGFTLGISLEYIRNLNE